MSLPITAVGPLKVETNPILMVSPASAGLASARAAAPASQNANFIFVSLLFIFLIPPADRLAPFQQAPGRSDAPFCARNDGPAASANRRLPLRTFGSIPMELHYNSYALRMARIIVPVPHNGGCGFRSWPMRVFSLERARQPAPTIRVRNRAIGKAGLEAKPQRPSFKAHENSKNRGVAIDDHGNVTPNLRPSRGDRRRRFRRAGMRLSAQGRAGLDHDDRPPQPSSVSA